MSIDSTVSPRTSRAADAGEERTFVASALPWILGAAALLVYLLSLNHWVSFISLLPVADVSGWASQPDLNRPLYWLVTLPLRLLPAKWVPIGLNLLSALCAAGVVALLARSVALLPHDRTEDQRVRERHPLALLSLRTAWLPPVLAVLACGLQLSFWENATVGSSEMLELLLFAYVIRCLLEFRLEQRDSWLYRAAAVYGAGMATNWAMIGFLPIFLTALIWLKGTSFFNLGFLTRMFLWAMPGLLLYLLMPIVSICSTTGGPGFWQAMQIHFIAQKQALGSLPFNRYALFHGLGSDRPLWVLALPSLLPVLVIAIRWPSYLGDISKLGVSIAKAAFHVVHGALLLVCLWVVLDPANFSPRQLVPHSPLLTFYYLGALSIGYFAGYFLLVFGKKPVTRWPRPEPFYRPALNKAVLGVIWAMLIVTPLLLLYRNWPQLRTTNGPMLRSYAETVAEELPAKGAALLSDDALRLTLVESVLAQKDALKSTAFVDTRWLNEPEYHTSLAAKYPGRWPFNPPKGTKRLSDFDVLQVVQALGQSNTLYYLNPSFGFYFEVFFQEPDGPIYRLKRYGNDQLLAPPLSPEVIDRNQKFWRRMDEAQLGALIKATERRPAATGLMDRLEKKLHLSHETNPTAGFLARYYSRALNYWGAQLQGQGRFQEAAAHFKRAVELNPDNIVARINRQCNERLLAGQNPVVELSKPDQDELAKIRNLDQVLTEDGPFDEPNLCYAQGQVFFSWRSYRQAAREFARVRELVPGNLPSRVNLAQIALLQRLPDETLKMVAEIHEHAASLGLNRTNVSEILSLEAGALLAKHETNAVPAAVQRTVDKFPADEEIVGAGAGILMSIGQFTNALPLLDQQLRLNPTNASALVNQGFAYLRLNAFDRAVTPLSRVVQMDTNAAPEMVELHYSALFNRAIAYFKNDQLDLAQADYDVLQQAFPKAFQFYYGPAEIAYRKKDTNAAIRNYELYLANAPANSAEASNVMARLRELKGSP